MATYRTIRMAFWSDPYIETLSASEKLLYLYLFSCPHTNNLGLLAVSRHPPPVQHQPQDPRLAPFPVPHGRVRKAPQGDPCPLSAPAWGRAVPRR